MPPWAETLADPVLSPKQTTESKLATAVKPNKGSSTNIDKEDWQLLESVTLTLYVPVLRLSKKETLPVPIPQSLTYGVIPPVTFIPIKPSLPPLQETSEKELILITKGSGTVIFCDKIMALGFHHGCKAGISFGKDDMVIPETKSNLMKSI